MNPTCKQASNRFSRGELMNMLRAALALTALLLALPAVQAATSNMAPSEPVELPSGQVLDVWPGTAPGSENAAAAEAEDSFPQPGLPPVQIVRNVSHPTLTVYRPDAALANGTAVIIAPGGAFHFLTIDQEGRNVAAWLVKRGITAVVLKYRLVETPDDRKAFTARHRQIILGKALSAKPGSPEALAMQRVAQLAGADGVQALKVVRAHAAEWGVRPDRVGMLGFSAGGMVTCSALLQEDPSLRPDFAAPIYLWSPSELPATPSQLPPIFVAMAQDDPLVKNPVSNFVAALTSAGARPEVHLYSAGGHGFGMFKQGTTSDHWIEEFYWWLEAQKLVPRTAHE